MVSMRAEVSFDRLEDNHWYENVFRSQEKLYVCFKAFVSTVPEHDHKVHHVRGCQLNLSS
jgi:hypothetical protein